MLNRTGNFDDDPRFDRYPETDFYDEDAARCECGHISRDHHEKAFNYACCILTCDCRGFQGAAA